MKNFGGGAWQGWKIILFFLLSESNGGTFQCSTRRWDGAHKHLQCVRFFEPNGRFADEDWTSPPSQKAYHYPQETWGKLILCWALVATHAGKACQHLPWCCWNTIYHTMITTFSYSAVIPTSHCSDLIDNRNSPTKAFVATAKHPIMHCSVMPHLAQLLLATKSAKSHCHYAAQWWCSLHLSKQNLHLWRRATYIMRI